MSYEVYQYIFIGGLVLSIIMLAVTVLIFFLFRIKDVIGFLTGSNKRKAIENRSFKKDKTEQKKAPSKIDYDQQTPSGKVAIETAATTKMSLEERYDHMEGGATTALDDHTGAETSVLSAQEAETSVLSGASETSVLGGQNTETSVIAPPAPVGETTVMEQSGPAPALNVQPAASDFVIEVDITYVHSNEVAQ